MTTNPAPPVPYNGPIRDFDGTVPLGDVFDARRHLATLVLSQRKRVTLTRDQLMQWIAIDGDAHKVLDAVVALFNSDEG